MNSGVPDDFKDLLVECAKDTRLAAKTFLPERFFRPFDEATHGRIFDLLDNSDNPKKVIAAPRGLGKTSIINLLLPLKKIVFQAAKYIVPVSATTSLATQQAENLKMELISNQIINYMYGKLATDTFNKQQWVVDVLGQDICIMPRGAGQQIRGMLYKNARPDLFLVDDLEEPTEMDSQEQRDKKKRWFHGDLLNSVDRGIGSKWEVIVLGTVLHQDSLLVELLNDKEWDSIKLEIADENLNSLSPNFIPTREIIKLHKQFKDAGQLDTFYREYMNDPVPKGEDASFPQELFKDYDPAEMAFYGPQFESIVIVDPAKTTNQKSAHSAIVGVTVNMRNNAVYVREIIGDKLHPDEVYDEACNMILSLNAAVVGIEVTGLDEFISYPFRNELIRRGIHVEFMELRARGGDNEKGKVKRIRSLIPLYRQGLMFHNPTCCAVLEKQLLSFPSPTGNRWDVMDALGYLPQILDEGERFMQPSGAFDEDPADIEREYLELENDYDLEPLDDYHIV